MTNNIDYYNMNAQEFFQGSVGADMSYWRERFMKYVPDGGRILDAGCGSGRDSKAFIEKGYSVVAFDASKEMCRLASEFIGQEVWQIRFDEMSFDDEFDGIWACASLLHVSENEMDSIALKLKDALVGGGTLYASFKYGEGAVEKKERSFTNFTEETLRDLFESAGFQVLETDYSLDVRPGREDEKWVNIICRK